MGSSQVLQVKSRLAGATFPSSLVEEELHVLLLLQLAPGAWKRSASFMARAFILNVTVLLPEVSL